MAGGFPEKHLIGGRPGAVWCRQPSFTFLGNSPQHALFRCHGVAPPSDSSLASRGGWMGWVELSLKGGGRGEGVEGGRGGDWLAG